MPNKEEKIKYLDKLSIEQKKEQILQVLNYTGNNTGRDVYGVASLFSNCANILSDYVDENFKKSLENSLECMMNKNFMDKLEELKDNDSRSFIIVPITSKNHLFNAIIYKKDKFFDCVLVNKGERFYDNVEFPDMHHEYEVYRIKESNIKKIIPFLGIDIRKDSTAGIYEAFKNNSKMYRELINIYSREQEEDNCYYKEEEAVLKFAYSFAYDKFKNIEKTEMKTPKWPISTKEMQDRILKNIEEVENDPEFTKFVEKFRKVYSLNKEFRDNMKKNQTLVYEKQKEIFYETFNKNGEKTLKDCLNDIDMKTYKKNYKFFEKLLKKESVEVPRGLFDEPVSTVQDTRNHIIKLLKENFTVADKFLSEYFQMLSMEIDLYYSRACVKGAYRYVEEGKYLDAIALFSNAINLNKDNMTAYVGRGITYNLLMSHNRAKNDFDRACEIDKNDINCRVIFAESHLAAGRYKDALEQYEEILKISPENVDVISKTANIYYRMGELDKAIESYNKVLELNPKNEIVLYKKLNILSEIYEIRELSDKEIRKNLDERLKVCDEILSLGKNNINIIQEKVYILINQKRREDAVNLVIDTEIDNDEFMNLREKILVEQLIEYNKQLDKNPDNNQLKMKKAKILNEVGKGAEAIKIYDDLLEKEPKNTAAMLGKAKALEKIEKLVEAYNEYNKIYEIEPKNIYVLTEMARLTEMLELNEKLLKICNIITKIEPNNVLFIEKKAQLLEKNNDLNGAIEQYKKLQKYDLDDIEVMKKIVDIAEKIGNKEEVLNQYTKMLQIDRDNIEIMRKRANILADLGKKEQAIKQCDEIIFKHPKDVFTKHLKKKIILKFREKDMKEKGIL